MRRQHRLQCPIRVVLRDIFVGAGDGADFESRVAHRRGESVAGAGEFSPGRFGLGSEAGLFDFELNQVEPGDLFVVEQGLPVLDRIRGQLGEFVQNCEPTLQCVKVVERRAHGTDDRVSLPEKAQGRLIDFPCGHSLGQRELSPGHDLLADLRSRDDPAGPLSVAKFVCRNR